MTTEKAAVIEAVCTAIDRRDDAAAILAAKEYPFALQANVGRGYSVLEATRVFVRDGFIDRHSGAHLVNPAVLRILSNLFPGEFPFHKNWKMDETHPAYWELVPTVNHIVPVARGGEDSESNWVTTSMLRNSAKANWTLEELGWQLLPAGDLSKWDGLTSWLILHIEERGPQNHDRYVIQWYKAAREALL